MDREPMSLSPAGPEGRSKTEPAFELHESLGYRPGARIPEPDPQMPRRRKLRVYAQDPGSFRYEGAIFTISIPYEALQPGPAGSVLVVEDFNDDDHQTFEPVDLEQPALLMDQGLAPSSTNRQFMQQMAYAVGMETYERFMEALGRDPGFGPLGGDGRQDGRLRIRPCAFEDANAYYDREAGALKFGYARAAEFAGGRSQPGARVYTALSREIVIHEMSHALLDGLRPNFMRPTHKDIPALHEGLADLIAVFMKFTQPEVVEQAIERTQGNLRDDLLASIGREFGFTLTDGRSPLRTALILPGLGKDIRDDQRYAQQEEAHELGSVLLSAVFHAFIEVFERYTGPVKRSLATYQGGLSVQGIRWLAAQASALARRFLNVMIRAIDYCPPFHCTFGEFLRAAITADHDLMGDEGADYREIIIASFRRFGVEVSDVDTLSEESLLWQAPEGGSIVVPALDFRHLGLVFRGGYCDWPTDDGGFQVRAAGEALASAICLPAHANSFGLHPPGGDYGTPCINSLRTLRRVMSEGNVNFDLVAEVIQKRKVDEGVFLGGSTVIVSSTGVVRYAIAKHVHSERRLQAQREWLARQDDDVRDAAWSGSSVAAARLQRRMHREPDHGQPENA